MAADSTAAAAATAIHLRLGGAGSGRTPALAGVDVVRFLGLELLGMQVCTPV
jgi:hypothetical protein